ncbi:efflux transporter outer membrane subunit [Pseudomonas aeruginosa]|nr:efflux transporter outer membrane subunit [Pseudomonas aeruginosa]TEO19053.1 efflux transporter outer membrane subunit [Pseudomonas aeruginosa]TEO21789.1 efflux transporter outer membrane subunit [Pseudomonas aeruginosa]TEO26120.1 efflux transporter outer membrane subunit [Pseudomonas aeruginosa]TEO42979.1 efflux transporter outer membrane subunit [Pseudomonas aeruginosa]
MQPSDVRKPSKVLKGGVVLASTLVLCSCAPLPHKSDTAMAGARTFASATSLSAPEKAWPSDRWWEGFGDAQLNSLIAEGLEGAMDLRVASARFAHAEALVQQTRSRLLPALTTNAEVGSTKQSYNYLSPESGLPKGWRGYGQTTIDLSWELDFWGRNRAALAAARSEAEAAGAEAASARLAVSASIASAYADLAGNYAEHDAAEHAIEVRNHTLELIEGRQEQGLENEGAVERARSSLATAQGDLAALNESLALTRNRIAALIGAGPDRGLAIKRPAAIVTGSFGLPANLPAELIGRRPDIIAARLRAEASASRIKEAHAAFYPNVNLAGLIGLQALGIGNVFKSGSDFGTVGPAISLPVFDGGRLRGQYRAAETDYQAAVAQYDGALTQALRDVADAAASSRALDLRLDHAQEAERAANAAWIVANNRYRGGLATYLDVLAAEDALISARRSVASLKTRALALDIALIRALGGGYRS